MLVNLYFDQNKVLLFEGNMTAQLKNLIRMNTSLDIPVKTRYDARPFFFQEVYQEVEKFVGGNVR